jgi:hypothetical protein
MARSLSLSNNAVQSLHRRRTRFGAGYFARQMAFPNGRMRRHAAGARYFFSLAIK